MSGALPRRLAALGRSAVISVLAAGVFADGGCATLVPQLEAPQLAITAVEFAGGSVQQQQIRLMLHATNPNNRAIAIKGIECDLEIAGMPFAHGETDAAFTLPALGAADFTINVSANLNNALAVLAASMGHKSVDYHFYGKVHLPGGILRTIPFDGTGRVRL